MLCHNCEGEGDVPALIETTTGYERCPYLSEPCEVCSGTGRLYTQADLDNAILAERTRCAGEGVTGETSDGCHTFNELYAFRKMYNAALFNEWAAQNKYEVHKSKRHYDGEECFGGGWFIVVAILPTGQISNHYKLDYWDLFRCEETPKVLYEYDGHNGQDVLARLAALDCGQLIDAEKVVCKRCEPGYKAGRASMQADLVTLIETHYPGDRELLATVLRMRP